MEKEKPTLTCAECGKRAPRLRKDRRDACYMRLYRGGEIAAGAVCAGCDEPRRAVLVHAELGDVETVVCGNCSVIIARTRPKLASVADLRARVTRDRRSAPFRRRDDGRRIADRLPEPPHLDPSID
jgi:hypothetical protein